MKMVVTTMVAGATLVLGAVAGSGAAGAVPVGAFKAPQTEGAAIDVRGGGRSGGGGFRGGGHRGGGFRGHGFRGHSFRGRSYHGPRFRRGVRRAYRHRRGWRHRRDYPRYRRYRSPGFVYFDTPFFYYGGPYYYDRPYYYRGPCRWLRRRAVRTGSRYWWRRYRRCVRRHY